MVNVRVQRFSKRGELRFCRSEIEVPDHGWALVVPTGAETASGEVPDVPEVFHDGEFVGDAELVETTQVDGRPFTELVYTPVPDEE